MIHVFLQWVSTLLVYDDVYLFTLLCIDSLQIIQHKFKKSVFTLVQWWAIITLSFSANGQKLFPFITFKAKYLWDSWIPEDGYPYTCYGVSPNYYMTAEVFYHWFKNHSLENCPKKRPLLIIMDGHTSHITIFPPKTCKRDFESKEKPSKQLILNE